MSDITIGDIHYLDMAQLYANEHSTCEKVQVGSLIRHPVLHISIYGSNHGIGYNCKENGCHRVRVYGENSKLHRLPSDCMAIHSEVDAICSAAKSWLNLNDATIYVTRYPCEDCARAIVQAGIKKVVYGRSEAISDMTRDIFNSNSVEVIHASEWSYSDDNS